MNRIIFILTSFIREWKILRGMNVRGTVIILPIIVDINWNWFWLNWRTIVRVTWFCIVLPRSIFVSLRSIIISIFSIIESSLCIIVSYWSTVNRLWSLARFFWRVVVEIGNILVRCRSCIELLFIAKICFMFSLLWMIVFFWMTIILWSIVLIRIIVVLKTIIVAWTEYLRVLSLIDEFVQTNDIYPVTHTPLGTKKQLTVK